MIRRLTGFLFMLLCLLPLLVSLLLVIPAYAFTFHVSAGADGAARAHRISRRWAAFLFRCMLIRFRCTGREMIDPSRTYVFIGNHRSLLDIPAYALACTNTFRFLSKAELSKVPLLGYVIRRLYITVNRADPRDRHRSLEKMLHSLQEGISVFLAPEGTRNTGPDPLLPFKDGAFRLAITGQFPVAVLVLHDTEQRLSPKLPLQVYPGTIHGSWLGVYETTGLREEDIGPLREKIQADMLACLRKGTGISGAQHNKPR